MEADLPVAIFSMEMGAAQLTMRLLGSVGKLDQHKMRIAQLEDDDWPKLTNALGVLNDLNQLLAKSFLISISIL